MCNSQKILTINRTKLLESNDKCEQSMDKMHREIKTKKIGEEQKRTFVNGIVEIRKENTAIERCSVRATNEDLRNKKKFTINITRPSSA